MSKGTRIYTFRLPEAIMDEVTQTIELRNQWTTEAPWTLSDFLRIALVEKVRKMERSRRRPIQSGIGDQVVKKAKRLHKTGEEGVGGVSTAAAD